MRRQTPHGDKLRELLNNSKLPAPDLPRVRDAIGRYEEWIASVAALTIPKRTIASGLLIPPSTTALAAAPWSHSRIWPALLPWQEARLSQSRGTSSATLSQSRHTHQASWRSNRSQTPSQTSPPPAPEANDHASTPDPQTRKASHSPDFNFDVQETGGSSLLACLFPRFRHHLWVPPAATSPQSRPGSRLGPRRRCHRVRVCRDLREAGTTARSRQPTTWLTVGGRNIDTEGPLNGGRNLVPGETPDC